MTTSVREAVARERRVVTLTHVARVLGINAEQIVSGGRRADLLHTVRLAEPSFSEPSDATWALVYLRLCPVCPCGQAADYGLMCRECYRAGQPVPGRTPNAGSFTEWSRRGIVGDREGAPA